jgi:hypothetical protein
MKLSVYVSKVQDAMDVYKGLEKSCGDHPFEVVIVSPGQPDIDFLAKPNTIWVQANGSESDRQVLGLAECHGDFVGVAKESTAFKDACVGALLDKAKDGEVSQCKCLNLAKKDYVVSEGGLGCLTVHKKPLVVPELKMEDEKNVIKEQDS